MASGLSLELVEDKALNAPRRKRGSGENLFVSEVYPDTMSKPCTLPKRYLDFVS